MGLTPARWLVDTSVLARVAVPAVSLALTPRLQSGLVGVCLATELEVGYSAQSTAHYAKQRASLLGQLLAVPMPFRAEQRAREVQAELVARGHHRSAGVADLMVAAIAEIEGLTVLHYDTDFDTIAAVTGQRVEWIVPRGSLT